MIRHFLWEFISAALGIFVAWAIFVLAHGVAG